MDDVLALPEPLRSAMLEMLRTNWAFGGDGTVYWDKPCGQLVGANLASDPATPIKLNSDLVEAYAKLMLRLHDDGFITVGG
jgi:hypothetical protein